MDFHAEPDFVHRSFEPRYFVRTLDEHDTTYARGNRWQIQFLNEVGQGAASLDFGPSDPEKQFELLAIEIPRAVIEAARAGSHEYIDAAGTPWDPILLRRVAPRA